VLFSWVCLGFFTFIYIINKRIGIKYKWYSIHHSRKSIYSTQPIPGTKHQNPQDIKTLPLYNVNIANQIWINFGVHIVLSWHTNKNDIIFYITLRKWTEKWNGVTWRNTWLLLVNSLKLFNTYIFFNLSPVNTPASW
jgi:hypothetical protein